MNIALTLLDRERLASFGYYADAGIGSLDPNRSRLILNCTAAEDETAIAKYQEFCRPSLQLGAQSAHNRDINVDGIWGTVCSAKLNEARCGVADFFTDEEAAKQGNWPDACRRKLEVSTKPGMVLNGVNVDEIIEISIRNWMAAIEDIKLTHVDSSKWPNTEIFLEAANLPRGVLADQFLANNNCSYRSRGRMDNGRTWQLGRGAATRSHEDGHAFGLPHSPDSDDVMYWQITQRAVSRQGKPTEGDIKAMERLGYQPRVGDVPPPPGGTTRVEITRPSGEKIVVLGVEF